MSENVFWSTLMQFVGGQTDIHLSVHIGGTAVTKRGGGPGERVFLLAIGATLMH